MTMDIRHIRSANANTTDWATLTEAKAALIGPGYDNALLQDLYTTAGLGAPNDSGTLVGLLRLTHDHRMYFYYVVGAAVLELEFIFAFS